MDTTVEWMRRTLGSLQITESLLKSSVSLMPPGLAQNLFSDIPIVKGNARGYLYESAIYEGLLIAAETSGPVKRVVAVRSDVPPEMRTPHRLGQDGFYYSELGEIKVRGNGIDLAEIDFLVEGQIGDFLFGEVVSSSNNLVGLPKEIRSKLTLLRMMLQRPVSSVLVSPDDLTRKVPVKELESVAGNFVVRTPPFEGPLDRLSGTRLESERVSRRSKLCYLRDLHTVPLGYVQKEQEARVFLRGSLSSDISVTDLVKRFEDTILDNVVIGRLDDDSRSALLNLYSFSVGEQNLDSRVLLQLFTHPVLALTLPELRPNLYFKSIREQTYLKFGPRGRGHFVLERLLRGRYTEYVKRLNAETTQLKPEETRLWLGRLLRPDVFGIHMRKGIPRRDLDRVLQSVAS